MWRAHQDFFEQNAVCILFPVYVGINSPSFFSFKKWHWTLTDWPSNFNVACVLSLCDTQLLQTTNNSPMNSKPQQIKMQSTKKGALTKREDGVPPVGMATGGPLVGDEPPSTAAAPPTPTALQPSVSKGSSLSFLALCSLFSSWRKDALEHHRYSFIALTLRLNVWQKQMEI